MAISKRRAGIKYARLPEFICMYVLCNPDNPPYPLLILLTAKSVPGFV